MRSWKTLLAFTIFASVGFGAICRAEGPATRGQLKDGDFVAVCGDSITRQRMYSVIIEEYLLVCQPAKDLRAMESGQSGEVAGGFLRRMEKGVLPLKPTVVTTCFGMNDGRYRAYEDITGKTYRDAQTAVVKRLKDAGVRMIVVGSPGAVDTDSWKGKQGPDVFSDSTIYNQTLGKLRDIAREVAAEQGVIFADVHTPMLDVMAKSKKKFGKGYVVAGGDGVHAGYNGHMIMAYALLRALGCEGGIGTVTLDLAGGKAEASGGHTVTASAAGSATITSTRYPYCFFGDATKPTSAKGILEFLPFNEELNRFTLVVKDAAPGKKYRVTWGTVSKQFGGEALAKGINLAAEFLENPFCEPFKKVHDAVAAQQGFEDELAKGLVMSKKNATAEELAAEAAEGAKMIAKDKALFDAARAAVAPVSHTIKVEAVKDGESW